MMLSCHGALTSFHDYRRKQHEWRSPFIYPKNWANGIIIIKQGIARLLILLQMGYYCNYSVISLFVWAWLNKDIACIVRRSIHLTPRVKKMDRLRREKKSSEIATNYMAMIYPDWFIRYNFWIMFFFLCATFSPLTVEFWGLLAFE